MHTIHIRKTLDSDTLHLPELQSLIGKTVDIMVRESKMPSAFKPGNGDWASLEQLAGQLQNYDFDAVRAQREFDRRDAGTHLP